ncbi:MAG: hypothetical protein ACRC9E_18215, partial [Plesiomonas shigelloides]
LQIMLFLLQLLGIRAVKPMTGAAFTGLKVRTLHANLAIVSGGVKIKRGAEFYPSLPISANTVVSALACTAQYVPTGRALFLWQQHL